MRCKSECYQNWSNMIEHLWCRSGCLKSPGDMRLIKPKMFRSIWLIKWGLNLAYQGHDQAKKANLKLDNQDEFELNSKCYKLNGEEIRISITHLDQSLILVQAQIGPMGAIHGPHNSNMNIVKDVGKGEYFWVQSSWVNLSPINEWINFQFMSCNLTLVLVVY